MADTVTTQTIENGSEIVMKFTNQSDGTGESAVVKVDVSAIAGAPVEVALMGIEWSTSGLGVDLLWDATTDVLLWHLPADSVGSINFGPTGIVNNAGSGKTGDILATTIGHSAGDRYSMLLRMRRRQAL